MPQDDQAAIPARYRLEPHSFDWEMNAKGELPVSGVEIFEVRFPSPVKVGERIRAGAEMIEVSEVKGGIQTLVRITIEIEGGARPACVIDSISRWLY